MMTRLQSNLILHSKNLKFKKKTKKMYNGIFVIRITDKIQNPTDEKYKYLSAIIAPNGTIFDMGRSAIKK